MLTFTHRMILTAYVRRANGRHAVIERHYPNGIRLLCATKKCERFADELREL
jgi:hypothetical protein